MKEKKVVALVVTFNRKKMLVECINALQKQTATVQSIVVIDNNSTDGTGDFFVDGGSLAFDNVIYKKLSQNIGGAGGFYEGFKYINENLDYDWLWLMDDDTIPYETNLERLLQDSETLKDEKVSFLASSVVGPEGEPMNVPSLSAEKESNGYSFWYKYLDKGLVAIEHATFVSLLISAEAIKQVGYPLKDYFIWGDDTEYTLRLTHNFGKAFFSGNSQILHKRFNAKSLSIINEENPNRVGMYRYFYRNNLLNFHTYFSKGYFLKRFAGYFILSFSILFNPKVKYRGKKFKAIQSGWWNFVLGRYDKVAFKNRFTVR